MPRTGNGILWFSTADEQEEANEVIGNLDHHGYEPKVDEVTGFVDGEDDDEN